MFLTAEDERARIKGSVDPLGLLAAWSASGRQMVANLTTVSNSVRGFSTLLIGRYLAVRLVEEGHATEDDALDIFLRFEQVAAYVREHAHGAGGDVRGIERVRKYTREFGTAIPIGLADKGEILGDQKTYGLWGLFSVPARESGLLPPSPFGLTAVAREFVETEYLPRLRPAWDKVRLLLQKPGAVLHLKTSDPVYKAVASALDKKLRAGEREFYGRALRDAQLARNTESDPPRRRQKQLAGLMRELGLPSDFVDRSAVTQLADGASARGMDDLVERMRKIVALESLIAPADLVFAHLCTRNGRSVREVVDELSDRWGTEPVPGHSVGAWLSVTEEFSKAMGAEIKVHAQSVNAAFGEGDWRRAIHALLEWNALVMRGRKGYPWISITNERLDVRYRAEARQLPDREGITAVWRNSYFLDSLLSITRQLEDAA